MWFHTLNHHSNKLWIVLCNLFLYFFLVQAAKGGSSAETRANEKDYGDLFEMSLDELMNVKVITATRTLVPAKLAPAAVYVLTRQQIQARGYRTLSEALQDLPGFNFQHTYGIFPELIHQRGLIGNNQRTLVAIDDILDNNLTEGAILGGTIRFPLANVERIEVVSGPASALYGANAFNGIINLITTPKDDRARSEVATTAGAWTRSGNSGYGVHFSTSDSGILGSKRVTYTVSGYYFKSEGPDFSGYQQLDDQGLGYWWSDNYSVSNEDSYNIMANFTLGNFRFEVIQWQYLQGDGTFANGTYQIDTDNGDFKGSHWDFRNNSARIGHHSKISPSCSLESDIIFRHTELLSSSFEQYPNHPGPEAYNNPEDTYTISDYSRPDYSYEIKERLHLKMNDRIDSTAGVEFNHTVVPKGYGEFDRYTYQNYATFLQGIFTLMPGISLTSGYRFDRNTIYGDSHTPRLGIVMQHGDVIVKALYGTGFRAPTAWELFNGTLQRKPNRDLDPELLTSYEMGIGWHPSSAFNVEGQIFLNQISDLILEVETDEYNPPQGQNWTQNQNVGQAEVKGVELTITAALMSKLNMYLNYSYTQGMYTGLSENLTSSPTVLGSDEMPSIAPHLLNAGVTYCASPHLSMHLRMNYVSKRKTINTNPIREVEPYFLVHGNLRWEHIRGSNLFLQCTMYNIFDQKAYDPGIRSATGAYYPTKHPISGRNIWLTVGILF